MRDDAAPARLSGEKEIFARRAPPRHPVLALADTSRGAAGALRTGGRRATGAYEGEEVDLGELAREAILLELPPIPRCADNEVCTREFDDEPKASKDAVDPRWGPIQAMLESKKHN